MGHLYGSADEVEVGKPGEKQVRSSPRIRPEHPEERENSRDPHRHAKEREPELRSGAWKQRIAICFGRSRALLDTERWPQDLRHPSGRDKRADPERMQADMY